MCMLQTALQKGFTLIELVMVIIILSVLGIMTSSYIGTGVDIYTGITDRDKSLNSVRFVMERLRREVSNALPNSAYVSDSKDFAGNINVINGCLTFTPIIASSIYGSDFPIAPINASSAIISPIAMDITAPANAVVYQLSADAPISQEITNYSAGQATLNFTNPATFPLSSPAKRVYITNDNISYFFTKNKQLRRGTNCIAGVLMAENITGSFLVSAASLQRNGLVKVTFNLDFDGQEVVVEQTLHINNVP